MRSLICGTLAVLVMGTAAQAANITYSDFAAWSAAVSPYRTVDFEGIVAAPDAVFYPGTMTRGGVTFSVGPLSAGNLLAVIGGPNGTYYPQSVISSQNPSGDPLDFEDLMISLPGVTTAMAFHFGHLFNGDVDATITLSDGSVYLVNSSAAPTLSFFGVVAPAGISWVDISLPADRFALSVSEFSYASPEPASMLLIGTGLAAMAGILRRRNSSRRNATER